MDVVAVESIALGDEVIYRADVDKFVSAEVIAIKDGNELVLSCHFGGEQITQRALNGPQLHGWLTYDQAAKTIVRA